jgi:sulfate adenylyltransferase subunit 2
MKTTLEHIKSVSQFSEKAILFHSAAGKDSIVLLDLMHPYFNEIVCVYMYIVPELEHINKYIGYAESKYNVKFLQTPHFALNSYIKSGYMGIKKNEKITQPNLSHITDRVKLKYGIDWAFFGFKQSDSMNRRLMLRTYEQNAINYKNKKCYPLSEWKNKDVLKYIESKQLINPIHYGGISQSSGTSIDDINFLLYCKKFYPNDYKQILSYFPLAEITVYKYEQEQKYRKTA